MFDVFSRLDIHQRWFGRPHDELTSMSICKQSGHRNTPECTQVDTVFAHRNALRSKPCNFHESILTDPHENYQYHINCSSGIDTRTVSKFVLPPLQAWYYQSSHPEYKGVPPFHPDCKSSNENNYLSIVYPENNAKLLATKDLSGNENGFIFEAVHQSSDSKLFWHMDNTFIGTTSVIHKVNFLPQRGEHKLTVLDEKGNSASVVFEVLNE